MKKLLAVIYIAMVLMSNILAAAESSNAHKRAIVVGASSGIGRALCHVLACHEYDIALVARREPLLISLQEEIAKEHPTITTWVKSIDVSSDTAEEKLASLIAEIGNIDLMVISVSAVPEIGSLSPIEREKKIIDVDLIGFWKMAHIALRHFKQKKSGHLVGISSIDALRGNPDCPAYSAGKAFIRTYLEGMRNRFRKQGLSIFITDILPGYVQTEGFDTTNNPGAYWVASAHDAATQIYEAIVEKKKQAFITKRWWIIGFLMQHLPDWLFYDVIGGL